MPFFPYPMESGGHQALYNGISIVKDVFNIFITFEVNDKERYLNSIDGFLNKVEGAKLIPFYKKNKTVFERIKDRIRRKHVDEVDERISWWKNSVVPTEPAWLIHIHNICVENQIDIVQIEMPWRISDIFSIPKGPKTIFVHHELGFVRRKIEIQNMCDNQFAEIMRKFSDFNEINQLNLYDAVMTLSPIDRQKLLDVGVKSPIYSSFAITNAYHEQVMDIEGGNRITFVGPDSHYPNIKGVEWFLNNCWEKLKKNNPQMQFDIIGKWTDTNIKYFDAQYSDIHFLGFVEDLSSAIKHSTMIVPITIGSGIRMKILEAANCGVPIVSTSIGAEGIALKNGEDCFLADTPDRFIECILKLQDNNLRNKFITNAKRVISENYSLIALKKNRISIYNQILNGKQK